MTTLGVQLPTLDSLKAEVSKAGYRVSAGSWEDAENIYAFSVETIPGTYGHPHFAARYCKRDGWLQIDGKPSVKLTI